MEIFDFAAKPNDYRGWTTDLYKADKYTHYITIPQDHKGPAIYLVIARYSDGDTFGHDDGYEEVIAVCADGEEALFFCDTRRKILDE